MEVVSLYMIYSSAEAVIEVRKYPCDAVALATLSSTIPSVHAVNEPTATGKFNEDIFVPTHVGATRIGVWNLLIPV